MNNEKCQHIGITGLARAGKNLFTDIFSSVIEEKYNLKCKSFALAFALKKDCEQFIKDKLGLSVWTEVTEEKTMFRDMLLWYGRVKREQTQGRYWIEHLQKYIDESDANVKMVTDVRYTTFDKDELYWVKNELNGKLIHVSKFSIVNGEKIYLKPPNEHEATHDPILKRNADIRFEWEDMSKVPYSQKMMDNTLRNRIYTECVKPIFES